MDRIPILKIGNALIVTIQVDMHDRLALALEEDLTKMIVSWHLLESGDLRLAPFERGPVTQMQWKMTAILRAIATFAFFMPMRLGRSMPHAFADRRRMIDAPAAR